MLTTLLALAGLFTPANEVLALDGDGDHVTIPSAAALQPPSAMTLEFWAFFPASGIGRVVNKGDGIRGTTNRSYDLSYKGAPNDPSTRILEALVTFNGGAATLFSAEVTPLAWNHVALTFDSSAGLLAMYVDGELAGSTTTTDGGPLAGKTLRPSSLPLVIGATPGFPVWDFEGQIDELRIWSVARSREEIECTMNTTIDATSLAEYPGLEGVWNLDGDASDEGGVHDGTVGGGATFVAAELPFYAFCGSLIGSGDCISLGEGGVHALNLDAGTERAGDLYCMLGSASGSSPGIDFDPVVLPLNLDPYTWLLLTRPFAAPFQNFLGVLDSEGRANAALSIPAGVDPGLTGTVLHHAYLVSEVFGVVDFASDAVAVELTP